MIESLAKEIAREFDIENISGLELCLGSAWFEILSFENWKKINKGPDELDIAGRHLDLATSSLRLAIHFFSGDAEEYRLKKFDKKFSNKIQKIHKISKKIEEISNLAKKAHKQEPLGRKPLDKGMIRAFHTLTFFWENGCDRPLRGYFKENDNYGRTKPGNDCVKFISKVLKRLEPRITSSQIKTLFQNYSPIKGDSKESI